MLAAGLLTVAVLAQSGPLSAVAAHRSSTHQAKLIERVTAAAVAQESSLVALRHDLHRHPELSGAETRTARLVAERLRALGFEVRTGVGGHGVVAVLRGGRPGPLVAFRADLDALASNAADPVGYRSLTAGVRHICGHDVHNAIGIGTADSFAAVRAAVPG
jgi:amidohydrolase